MPKLPGRRNRIGPLRVLTPGLLAFRMWVFRVPSVLCVARTLLILKYTRRTLLDGPPLRKFPTGSLLFSGHSSLSPAPGSLTKMIAILRLGLLRGVLMCVFSALWHRVVVVLRLGMVTVIRPR